MGVYINDLHAFGTDAAAVNRFFVKLGSLLIKNLGTVSMFLCMRVIINNSCGYVLDHAEAIDELLRKHGLEDANSTKSLIGAGMLLKESEKMYELFRSLVFCFTRKHTHVIRLVVHEIS